MGDCTGIVTFARIGPSTIFTHSPSLIFIRLAHGNIYRRQQFASVVLLSPWVEAEGLFSDHVSVISQQNRSIVGTIDFDETLLTSTTNSNGTETWHRQAE